MRALIGTGVLLILACGTAAAQDTLDPKKLTGTWDAPGDKAKKVAQNVLEIGTDGRAWFKVAPNADSEFSLVTEYKYEVKGKAVLLTKMTRDGDEVLTFRVTKLTDDVLEATGDGGVKYSFKRLKTPVPPKPEDKK